MKYTVTYYNRFKKPYYGLKTAALGIETDCSSWEFEDKNIFITCIKDTLDSPEQKLTDEAIKHDFGSHEFPLSESMIIRIRDYYNGRLALCEHIIDEIESRSVDAEFDLRYDIDAKYNSFSETEDTSEQLESYIKVSAHK